MKESTPTLWIEYERLEYLNKLKNKRRLIEQEETRLSVPLSADMEKLTVLYYQFRQVIRRLPESTRPDQRACRKMFLFIALYLYSPSALVGKKIDPGLRLALAEVMGFTSPGMVNYYCNGVGVWCTAYPDFKRIIDFIYPQIISGIGG